MRRAAAVAVAIVVHVSCVVSLSVAFLVPVTDRRPRGMAPLSTTRWLSSTDDCSNDGLLSSEVQCATRPEEASKATSVGDIMDLLERTYPDEGKERWTKARRYLYQHRVRTSASRKRAAVEGEETKRRRRRNSNQGPLTIENVEKIVSFLQSTFPDDVELQAKIVQQSPRVLGQYHSIESRLVPTVDFLRGLYGGMAGSDGREGGMMREAISRNTDLLLVRGVGYTAGGGGGGGRTSASTVRGSDDYSSIGNGSSEVEEHLLDELGLSNAGIAKLKRNHPTVFQLSLEEKVKPAVEYLHSLLGHGQMTKVSKIITNHPMLLQLDVAANLAPTAGFLQEACDLSSVELATVIAATPGILGLSVKGNLEPTMQFLLDILNSGGVQRMLQEGDDSEEDASRKLLRKCILKHPQILALSLSNLSAKRDYFDGIGSDNLPAEYGNSDRDTEPKRSLAACILLSAPSTYSLSLSENIMPKVEYLARLWGINAHDVSCAERDGGGGGGGGGGGSLADNLREYPQILTLSQEGNILPTLSFYNMTGYIDLDEDGLPRMRQQSTTQQSKFTIRSRYVATSLYNRLLPRWHFLLEEHEKQQQLEQQLEALANANAKDSIASDSRVPTAANAPPSRASLPPLHLLAGASDETFCRQMQLSLNDYLAYKEDAVPRLKFSSQFAIWLKTGRPIDVTAAPSTE